MPSMMTSPLSLWESLSLSIGSTPSTPDIPGINGKNVTTCRQVLPGEKKTGKKIVIIGGGLIGCETGDFLAQKGKEVVLTFPEAAPMTLEVVDRSIRNVLLERLATGKVKILAGVKQFQEINSQGIKIVDQEGNEIFLEADNIVLAAGAKPDQTLAELLRGKVSELYEVGDCVEARRIADAIEGGAEAGLQI